MQVLKIISDITICFFSLLFYMKLSAMRFPPRQPPHNDGVADAGEALPGQFALFRPQIKDTNRLSSQYLLISFYQ